MKQVQENYRHTFETSHREAYTNLKLATANYITNLKIVTEKSKHMALVPGNYRHTSETSPRAASKHAKLVPGNYITKPKLVPASYRNI